MKAGGEKGREGKLLQRRLTSTIPPAIPARLRRSPLASWVDGSTRAGRSATGRDRSSWKPQTPGVFPPVPGEEQTGGGRREGGIEGECGGRRRRWRRAAALYKSGGAREPGQASPLPLGDADMDGVAHAPWGQGPGLGILLAGRCMGRGV